MKIFLPRSSDCQLVTVHESPIESFRRYNDTEATFVDSPRDADLIVLFEEWRTQFWTYAQTLADNPFFQAHWRRIYTVNGDDHGRGFLPGCYASLTPVTFDPALHRACAFPYRYNRLVSEGRPPTEPKYLFSFRGSAETHPVRRKMFRYLQHDPRGKMACVTTALHEHSDAQKREYVEDILASAFALCPRGWSPSTYRMFEVMELGRCPVIISDAWIPIEGPSWDRCAIRIRESQVKHCADILREREGEAQELGLAARAAWEAHFSEPKKFRSMLRFILQIKAQRGDDDYRSRWSTLKFRHANGWLPHQRLAAGVSNRLRASSR